MKNQNVFAESMAEVKILKQVETTLNDVSIEATLQINDNAPSVDFTLNNLGDSKSTYFVRIRTNTKELWVSIANDVDYSEDYTMEVNQSNLESLVIAFLCFEYNL